MSELNVSLAQDFCCGYFGYCCAVQVEWESKGMCAALLKDEEIGLQSRDEETMGGAPRLNTVDGCLKESSSS